MLRWLPIYPEDGGRLKKSYVKLWPEQVPEESLFFTGSAGGICDLNDALQQGKKAARGVLRLREKALQGNLVSPVVVTVDKELCEGCGLCTEICPCGGIEHVKPGSGPVAREVDNHLCHGGGTCAATCPYEAIKILNNTAQQLEARIKAMLARMQENEVLGFVCGWGGLASADQAGDQGAYLSPGDLPHPGELPGLHRPRRPLHGLSERGQGHPADRLHAHALLPLSLTAWTTAGTGSMSSRSSSPWPAWNGGASPWAMWRSISRNPSCAWWSPIWTPWTNCRPCPGTTRPRPSSGPSMPPCTGPGCAGSWGRACGGPPEKEFPGSQFNAVDADETMLDVLKEEFLAARILKALTDQPLNPPGIARAMDEPVKNITPLLTDMANEGRITLQGWEGGYPVYALGKT